MVVAFAKQVNVKIREFGRSKGVRIVDGASTIAFFVLQLVVCRQRVGIATIENAFKKIGVANRLHRLFGSGFWQYNPCGFCIGQIGSHHPDLFAIKLDLVGTEHFKGVVVLVVNDAVDLLGGNGIGHEATYGWGQ